ncbi:MAG: hypothetical protein JWP39_169, partial [Jatrophihabitans sp.]|nr:hypothetical protein [Jatrophihabitans sp.]
MGFVTVRIHLSRVSLALSEARQQSSNGSGRSHAIQQAGGWFGGVS